MARFNLNQILSDASKAAASGGEPIPRPAESRIERISVFDLVPSEENFYSMREIDELKAAIEIAGKVLQNLVVVPMDGGKYKVIAGQAAACVDCPCGRGKAAIRVCTVRH